MSASDRLLELLRGTLPTRRGRPRAARTALDDALLFRAYERATDSAESAMSASQAAGASAAQQRSAVDAAVDGVRSLLARAREARTSAGHARESLDQIRLVALNAGLEGARLGDPAGKPLVLVAEEVRAHVSRAFSALEEHARALEQMDRERDKLREQVEAAQQRASDLARELLQAQAAQRDASSALGDLGTRIKDVTDTDPETARSLAEAADHARALVQTLSSLASKPHRASLLGALAPSLGPLFKLLREVYRAGADGGEG